MPYAHDTRAASTSSAFLVPVIRSSRRFAFSESKEGARRTLVTLLALKFGELPPSVHDRIEAAPSEQLDRWMERVLTAPSLQEVFDG